MSLFPIVIPSKGRPQGQTMQRLAAAQVPFTVYVEPHEVGAYRQAGWTLRVLAANDQGLPYVRRQILADAEADWFWMLDDDIDGWYQTVRGKNVRTTPDVALGKAQQYFAPALHIAQAALEYQQYAWSAKQPYVLGGYCDVCVAIHAERTRLLTFRDGCDVKLDRDFTLQVLASGYETCRVTAYSFSCPKNGSNAGGLSAVYAEPGREAAASHTMAQLWPGICTLQTKKDGRQDVAIDWRYFRRLRQAHH
jgi:hypothetical protein